MAIGKIEGPGSVRGPQQIKRAAKTSSTSGSSFARSLDDATETGATGGVSSANAIGGVLGVQEIDDALAQASKGKLRALDILDRLEDLRIELLSGTVSREKLQQLTQVVSARRGEVTDPRLGEVLDEIDLRAQVELAKYEVRDQGR